jgi:hypothetical protein
VELKYLHAAISKSSILRLVSAPVSALVRLKYSWCVDGNKLLFSHKPTVKIPKFQWMDQESAIAQVLIMSDGEILGA